MQRFLTAATAAILTISCARAGDLWVEDLEKAKATAAKENRDLLLNFTGSDWCGWCMKLDEEVFGTETFGKEAPKQFVLVTVDFPREKELPEKLQAQNEKLQADFKVEGFPTIVLADATGRPYAVTGYEEGGPAKYLKHLAGLRKIRETRDAGLKKAASAEGVEKAKLIVAALKGIDSNLANTFYKAEIEEAIAADSADVTGAKKARDEYAAEEAFKEKVARLEGELEKLAGEEKFTEFVARIDKFVADEKLKGPKKQELLLAKLNVYGPDKLEEAYKVLDAVIAVDPKTEIEEQAKNIQ
jgi:thioredoxin-related protein